MDTRNEDQVETRETSPRKAGRDSPFGPVSRLWTGRRGASYTLVAPAVGVLVLVMLVPVLMLLARSVREPVPGLSNYTALLTDATAQTVMVRTLKMSLIVTLVTLAVGYPYAYVLSVAGPRLRAVLMAVVLIPFWTSLMARTFAWVVIFGEGGPLQDIAALVSLHVPSLLGTTLGVTIAMTQVLLPFMVLPLYSAMRGVDRRLVDAAISLGAAPWKAFLKVYFPLTKPGVAGGSIIVFILALGFYITPRIIGSPQNAMISQLIVVQADELLNFAKAGALAATLIVVTILLLAVVSRFTKPSKAFGLIDEEFDS
jgi:putative spermidine/putrescine transport system permease protein